MRSGNQIGKPFEYQRLLFIPTYEGLFTTSIGEPKGQTKLGFPPSGMHIRFPHVVDRVTLTITNHSGRLIIIDALFEDEVIQSRNEIIYNETKMIELEIENTNGVLIRGGDFESALVSICLCLSKEVRHGMMNENLERYLSRNKVLENNFDFHKTNNKLIDFLSNYLRIL